MGPYGQGGMVYVPEIKWAGADWYQPSSGIMGQFDLNKQVPANLYFIPEATPISLRVRGRVISAPNTSGSVSNSLDMTTLPFAPNVTMAGFDTNTGLIAWKFYDNSLINHGFQFEASAMDARGQPLGWQVLNIRNLLKDPGSLRPQDQAAFTDMPPEFENRPVLLRIRTSSGLLMSVGSQPRVQVTMGLALPTAFAATPGASGIALSWKNHSNVSTAEIWILRTPGVLGPYGAGQIVPIAKLSATATSYTDQPPLAGTYAYQACLYDGSNIDFGPTAQVDTADSLTFPSAPIPTNAYRVLVALSNGNVLVGNGFGGPILELKPDGGVASTLNLPSDADWGGSQSSAIDSAGFPHLLYQTYNQGYVTRHAWQDATGWHEETLPPQFPVSAGSHLFCLDSDQVWIVQSVSPTDYSTPMTFKLLRKVSGQWVGETITSPGSFIPTIYSTNQCVALHPDGTLSMTYTAGTDQVLLQRKPDGSLIERVVPFLPDFYNATRSMAVQGLVVGPDNLLRLFRLDGNSAVLQTFDGMQFSSPEIVPVPASLTGSLQSPISPSISGSGGRLAWVLSTGQYAFVCLRNGSGWRLNSASTTTPFNNFLAGFRGELFWQCHLEPDLLNLRYRVVFEVEP